MSNFVNDPEEEWGGPWTEKKLEAFIKYVRAYLTIMNKYKDRYGWKTIYFDGFAGSGERKSKATITLFDQLEVSEEQRKGYQGAAERVVKLPVPFHFDFYYFIEKRRKDLNKLKQRLKSQTEPERFQKLQFIMGDCNELLNKLSSAMKEKRNKYAALIFLDPFGMQIDWSSIAQLQGTRSDVWILIPTGVIINRLLDRRGELKHIKKLESFLGMQEYEIRERFYRKLPELSLFDGLQENIRKIEDPISTIAEIYIENMSKIWKHVTKSPLRLNNTRGVPLFHFVFASNNANALKIARDIIKFKIG